MKKSKSKINFSTCLCFCLCLLLVIIPACIKKPDTATSTTLMASKSQKNQSAKKTISTITTSTQGNKTDTPASSPLPESDKDNENDTLNPVDPDNEGVSGIGAFAGLKFNVGNIDCNGKTYVVYVASEAAIPVAGRSASDDIKIRQHAKTEEMFNVKIEFKFLGNITAQIEDIKSMWLSGIPWADGPYIYSWVMPWGLINNLFIPLDDYINFTHEKFNAIEMATRWIDGKHYSFRSSASLGGGNWLATTYYNTNILDREGLQDILNLYINGQWTWNQFRDYAIQATRDTNGDGIIDQWGIAEYPANSGLSLPTLLRYSNTIPNTNLENNNILFNGFEEPYLASMQFYQTLKHIDKVVGVQSNWGQSKALMILSASSFRMDFAKVNLPCRQAPVPIGPNAISGSTVVQGIDSRLVPAVSKFSSEELIAIGLYREYNDPDDPLVYQDPFEAYMVSAENPATALYCGTEEERLFYYDYINNTNVAGMDIILGTYFNNTIIAPYILRIGNGEGVATVMDSARPSIESYINDLINSY